MITPTHPTTHATLPCKPRTLSPPPLIRRQSSRARNSTHQLRVLAGPWWRACFTITSLASASVPTSLVVRTYALASYLLDSARLRSHQPRPTMSTRPQLFTRGLSGLSQSQSTEASSPAEQRDDAKRNFLKTMRPLPTQHYWNIYFDRSVRLSYPVQAKQCSVLTPTPTLTPCPVQAVQGPQARRRRVQRPA